MKQVLKIMLAFIAVFAACAPLYSSVSINESHTDVTCHGGTNGSIQITPVGVAPFSYDWGGGITSQNRTNLSAGTYTVTVTDNSLSADSISITISEPTAININLVPVALTCFGSGNGAINNTVSGGVGPYSYDWGGGITTKNITGLVSGNYQVTVTDAHSCVMVSPSVFVPQPLQLTATAAPSPLTCAGGSTGSVTTNVNGGTGAYSYWWGSGVTSANRVNVSAGTYTVTITDANSCSVTASATITAYVPITLSTTQTNNGCYGGSTGVINLTVNNGWAPYTFAWSDGSTSQNADSLSAGSYTVTVTDNHSCTATKSANITEPPFTIVINSTISDVSCFGGNNGSISLNVVNGTPPYTYTWTSGSKSALRTNLAAGTYNVTITDVFSCTSAISLNVSQPNLLVLTPTVTDVSCSGGASGSISMGVTGGVPPFTYHWNSGTTTQTRNSLSAGTYLVTVTDYHACTSASTITVNQPTPLTVTYTSSNVSCFGGHNGSIHPVASGGTAPYTYNWGGGMFTQNNTGLGQGNFFLTVTDNMNCSFSLNVPITEPGAIVPSTTYSNENCNGGNNASINLSVVGGNAPYAFQWSDASMLQNRSNLTAGTYKVTVTDNTFCTATSTTTITQPAALQVSATVTNASCYAGNNGAISLGISGGSFPYSCNWGGGIITQNRNNLTKGTYIATISDQSGCQVLDTFFVSQPVALFVSSVVNPVSCFGGSDGSVSTFVSGGTSPYTYNWGGGINTSGRTSLAAGSYVVTVTDNALCQATLTSAVNQPTALTVAKTVTNVSCNGGSNGAIQITPAGGTSPYTYNWGGGVTTQNRSNITAGTYPVTITDQYLCSTSASILISEPAPLVVNLSKTDVACYGQANGTIQSSTTGGTSPYTFNWGAGVISQNRSGLLPGSYAVTVTDLNSCSVSASATVTQPSQIFVSIGSVTNAKCFGAADGGISINPTGGAGGYSFLWSNNATSQNLPAIAGGTYVVTVTDANLCTASTSATVSQPASISITLGKTDLTCFGSGNGSALSTVTGGNGGFTYNWSNNQTSASIHSLTSATYILTVHDANNCSASSSITVNQPAQIQITETHVDVNCSGTSNGSIAVTPSGGVGGYTYLWNTSAITSSINGLSANIYSITVTDANLCSASAVIAIGQSSALSVSTTHSDFSCANKAGSIQLNVTGGAGPYNYNWGGGITTNNRVNLNSGNYSVTVSDANACSTVTTITISQLPGMATSFTKTDVTCFGGNNGAVTLSVTNGLPPYTYHWNNGSSAAKISSVSASAYWVTITDANGCQTNDSVAVVQPSAIVISKNSIDATCYNGADGSITTAVSGGSSPYIYKWSNAAATPGIQNIQAGQYSLTVSDAAGCSMIASNIVVQQPSQITINATVTAAGCTGTSSSNGSIGLNVSGGTAPYSFAWNTSATSATINGLTAGNYDVTVRDNNNCSVNQVFHVANAAPFTVTPIVHNTSCPTVQNGHIDLAVSGGTGSYTFNWSGGQHTAAINQLTQGAYQVTISDANGCSVVEDYTITYDYDLVIHASPVAAIYTGERVQLNAAASSDHRNEYTWTPSNTLICSECESTEAHPTQTTLYTVKVVDANGCKAEDTVTVEVIQVNEHVFLPNVFTPNGDGNNDALEIFGDMGGVKYFDLVVFNRGGEKVFETKDNGFRWDGTYKGDQLPSGAYVYMLKMVFSDSSKKETEGSVTILR